MNRMTLKTVTGLLSKANDLVRRHSGRSLGVLAALVLVGAGVASIDWSPSLTADEVAVVRDFVIRTGSTAVRDKFNDKISGGLTVNEVQQITEMAKRQDPEYGLISDQKNNK